MADGLACAWLAQEFKKETTIGNCLYVLYDGHRWMLLQSLVASYHHARNCSHAHVCSGNGTWLLLDRLIYSSSVNLVVCLRSCSGKSSRRYQRMDITQWHATFLGALIVLPMTTWVVRRISSVIQKNQHVFHKYVSISRKITLLEVFLVLIIFAANAFSIIFDVHSTQALVHRSGLLSSINFAFLCFGSQMTYLYKTSVPGYDRVHYLMVGISIAEALIHSVIGVILKMWRTDIVSQITNWMVCLASSAPIAF